MKGLAIVDLTPGERSPPTPTGMAPRRRLGAGGRQYKLPPAPKPKKPDPAKAAARELTAIRLRDQLLASGDRRRLVRDYLDNEAGRWVRTQELQEAFCAPGLLTRQEVLRALAELLDVEAVAERAKPGGSYWMRRVGK